MKWAIKALGKIAKKSFINLVENSGIEHAGYMAFMLLLSLFPSFVIFLLLAHIMNLSHFIQVLFSVVQNHLISDIVGALKEPIKELINTPAQNLITIFLVSYVWTASSFIEGLRTILNRVYKVQIMPTYIFRRFLSLIQFMVLICSVFLVSIIMFTIPKLHQTILLIPFNQLPDVAFSNMKYGLLVIILFFLACWFYMMIPNIKIKFKEVVPGAFISSVLWVLCVKFFCENFVYYSKINFIYGSLGNIVLTLLLFYLVNLIFIYGAEFNYASFKKN